MAVDIGNPIGNVFSSIGGLGSSVGASLSAFVSGVTASFGMLPTVVGAGVVLLILAVLLFRRLT